MKPKSKSSWLQLYIITAAGCALLFVEALLPLSPLEQHLILIITLLSMFWLAQQWLKSNRFRLTTEYHAREDWRKVPAITIQTYQPQGMTPAQNPVRQDNPR